MDIKTQIQQEAEKRYDPDAVISSIGCNAFQEGAEWLDTEIVQPLRKENKTLERVLDYERQLAKEKLDELQSQLSLSEGRVIILEGFVEFLRGKPFGELGKMIERYKLEKANNL